MQYKACLAITGAIEGTSPEHLYKEIGLESLIDRIWVCKLTFFHKIVKENSPQYLPNYLKGNSNSVYNIRSAIQISLNTFRRRTKKFKNCISEWNESSNLTKQSENTKKFKNILISTNPQNFTKPAF